MTFKKVVKILRQDGWVFVRSKGSHFHFKKEGVKKIATVVYHAGKDVSIGVLKNLEKGTGLSLKSR